MNRCMKRPRPKPVTSPLLPPGVEIIVPPPPFEACTLVDRLLVYASSLIVVGSPIWFYGGLIFLYRRWKRYRELARGGEDGWDDSSHERPTDREGDGDDDDGSSRRRSTCEKLASRYGAALAILVLASTWGPHRNRRVGEILDVRRWRLWDAWLNYVGFAVLRDAGGVATSASDAAVFDPRNSSFDPLTSPALYAFVPHGIFPFGLAFSALPERGYGTTWGRIRPVVATATRLFPLVRTLIDWMGGVDASRAAVSRALSPPSSPGGVTTRSSGDDDGSWRLGISPGGIAEMFETYPKPGYHPNDEAALLRHRDGLFRLALSHGVPIVPVYCFGATKMFRRVQLPRFVETLSRALRISLCLLYGRWGLPIPFRQRLTYVVGNAIWPPGGATTAGGDDDGGATATTTTDERLVREMHDAFCVEIGRIFDRNKGHYGWENKTLRLV